MFPVCIWTYQSLLEFVLAKAKKLPRLPISAWLVPMVPGTLMIFGDLGALYLSIFWVGPDQKKPCYFRPKKSRP